MAIFPQNPIFNPSLTQKTLCMAIPLIQSDLCDLADLCFVPAVFTVQLQVLDADRLDIKNWSSSQSKYL